jgi:hypothetical protein
VAITLTSNLRLRLSDNLDADSKYNLNRIDTVGGITQVLTSGNALVRSSQDIQLVPNSADLGSNGSGGKVTVGDVNGQIEDFRIYADVTHLDGALALLDLSGGNHYVRIRYESTDTASTTDKNLFLNLGNASRTVSLGGNLTTSGGNIVLSSAVGSTLVLPASGTLATLAGAEILTNKSISGTSNTLSGIGYTSLVLTNSLVNADIATGAAISRSKIAAGSANHVLINNSVDGTISSEAQLAITRGGTGASTASNAINNLLPSQTGNNTKYLSTNGSNPIWVEAPGSGTVTSVGLSLPPSIFSVTGSPVEVSGTLSGSLVPQVANRFLSGPISGMNAEPTFRSINLNDLPGITTTSVSEGLNLYFTDQRVEDVISGAVISTPSVDLLFSSGKLSATVLPAGVDHDSLDNYVADKHVDHSTVSISPATDGGLSGGGNLTASRTLSVDPSQAVAETIVGSDLLLFSDVSNASALRRSTAQGIADLAQNYETSWTDGSSSLLVNHSLGTSRTIIQVYDASGATVYVDDVTRNNSNSTTLTRSVASVGEIWKVVISK